MHFYETLQSIMAEKELTIPDVARLSGLPDSTIRSMISRKNKTVALEVAFKLSKGLGVTLEQLNGEASEMLLSPVKQEFIRKIQRMPDNEVIALLAFADSLNNTKKALNMNKKHKYSL